MVSAHLGLAKLALSIGNQRAALEHYQDVIEIIPNHLDASISIAQLLRKFEGDISFISWLEKARDAHPQSLRPPKLLVAYYLQIKDEHKALDEATRFYNLNKKDKEAMSLMTSVYLARKEFDAAQSSLQDILALYPDDITHRLQLAQMHFSEGRV